MLGERVYEMIPLRIFELTEGEDFCFVLRAVCDFVVFVLVDGIRFRAR